MLAETKTLPREELEHEIELSVGTLVHDPVNSFVYRVVSLNANTVEVEYKSMTFKEFCKVNWFNPNAWDEISATEMMRWDS